MSPICPRNSVANRPKRWRTSRTANGLQYQYNSAADFGLNHDGLGHLSGFAWGANVGWLTFTNRDAQGAFYEGPTVDLATGRLSGFIWSANCGWISLSSAASGELIVNGSFENLNNSFVADVYGLMSLPAGSTLIPGWTTLTAELAWVSNTNTFGAARPFGAHALELTGYHDGQPCGGVRQTIPTTPGQSYRLSPALGSNADYPGAGGQKTVSVNAGSTSTTLTFTPTNTTGNVWQTFSTTFTATSAVTVITIGGLSSDGGVCLGLDDVSVVPLTPVPSGLRITALERLGSDLRLSFTSESASRYAIQSRAALDTGEWATLPARSMPARARRWQ